MPMGNDESTKAERLLRLSEMREPAGECKPYLTILSGTWVGRTFQLGAGRLLVGRARDSDIALDDEGVSRRHALFVCTPDGKVTVEDLQSTNGTSVDGNLIDVYELQGGEQLQFGSATVFKFELRDTIEERFVSYLYESVTQDHLTGSFNRRYLEEQLRVEFAWHRRHKQPLSVVLIDVDYFKQINDKHGHIVGDSVLRQLASRCKSACRVEDVFARYGGEEFACLLRQTNAEQASVLAERIRQVVSATPFEYHGPGRDVNIDVTVSAGVVELSDDMEDLQILLDEADRMLYAAKNQGRNRVAAAS